MSGISSLMELRSSGQFIYEATIRYSAPNGQKGYDWVVNGAKPFGMFPATGALSGPADG